MSKSTEQHRKQAPTSVRCAIVTLSDTRTLETDSGGQFLLEQLESAGHIVVTRDLVPDDPTRIQPLLVALSGDETIDAVLLTGGTGIAGRDQTYETVSAMLTKTMPGYGEIFRMLSFEEIGAAAMLSRAIGGLIEKTVVLTMPGSRAAIRLALDKLILPEIGHLVFEANK